METKREQATDEASAVQGEIAPMFLAEAVAGNNQITKVGLNDYKGKWVILFFYPADFTPV